MLRLEVPDLVEMNEVVGLAPDDLEIYDPDRARTYGETLIDHLFSVAKDPFFLNVVIKEHVLAQSLVAGMSIGINLRSSKISVFNYMDGNLRHADPLQGLD